jgi:hypothetical protein
MTFEGLVPQNATLESLLRQQLPADLTRSVVDAVAGVFNPRDLRAEQAYQITRGLDGLFREFRYAIDADTSSGSRRSSRGACLLPRRCPCYAA